MTHRLLVFGDSWAYGSELDVEHREQQCFGGQLAQMLMADSMHNCAETGSSISHLHIQFQKALTRINYDPADRYTAVFFLTGQQRFLAFDPDQQFYNLVPTGASVRPVQQQYRALINTVNDFYYKNIQSDPADVISLNTNLLALQAICQYHQFDDYYISGWQDLHVWPEIDQSRIYPCHCQTILESNSIYFEPNVSHPNALGHRLIAEKLFEFIKLKQVDNTF